MIKTRKLGRFLGVSLLVVGLIFVIHSKNNLEKLAELDHQRLSRNKSTQDVTNDADNYRGSGELPSQNAESGVFEPSSQIRKTATKNITRTAHRVNHEPLYHAGIVNPHNFKLILNPGKSVCGKNKGEGIFLLAFVLSAATNERRRQAIRQTWANKDLFYDVRVVFVVGKSKDHKVNNKLRVENAWFNDIVQEDFLDTYRNLTYKTIAGLKWVSENCVNAKYVLKTDDDTIVSIAALKRHLTILIRNNMYTRNSFICDFREDYEPVRETDNKHYVTMEEYSRDMYDPYCHGPFILITGDLVPHLYEASLHVKFFWIEDVYWSGQLARLLGSRFFNIENEILYYTKLTEIIIDDLVTAITEIPDSSDKYLSIWQDICDFEMSGGYHFGLGGFFP